MKDHIHTIPVLDALRDPGGCPFCVMQRQLEQHALDFIMSPAYMDEDVRDETNEAGFCAHHLQELYGVQNRLGTALLIHTHVQHIRKQLEHSGAGQAPGLLGDLVKKVKKAKGSKTPAGQISAYIEALQSRCYLCEKAATTFKRYMGTFFHLWVKEKEVLPLVEALPGFCLPHYGQMLEAAQGELNQKQLEQFLSVVIPLQQRALEKMDTDLEWFTLKFDYRNAEAPWKDSKDALPRAMGMLRSWKDR